ncbi:kinase-like protein [Aspergillus pseudonomiae]|uniref:Kinase-like protein n=1 Tax=Aspergillus pseudonomiae TaxID=1506151 RepID=A0A5N7CTC5_9EURO|nr:kinase-like protein [Aspergillus pseudonomiae]KAE8396888.1 kinase-like protein [Aspergillus pseudonomiae]
MVGRPVESNLSARKPQYSLIAVGTTSAVFAIDSYSVLKRRPGPTDDFACQAYNIEVRAYERLGDHPRIARIREVTEDGIVIERGECLRQKIQSKESQVTMQTKLRWAQEAAEGLHYIHTKNIIHADVGCHNLLLDQSGHIKFIDFGGSGIDDEVATVCYEWCSYRPGSDPDIKTDIFAFGSTLFEIETGEKPYQELEKTLGPGKLIKRVEHLFTMGEYPRVDMLVLGGVILHCWNGDYCSMDEVSRDINACCQGMHDTGDIVARRSGRCVMF